MSENSMLAIIGSAEIREMMGYNDQQFNLNHIYESGNTLLTAAIRASNLSAVNDLIRRGANVNQREEGGATPLLLATHLNKSEIVEVLLKNRADVNKRDSYDTPLTVAVRKGHLQILKLLVDYNAITTVVNTEGMSPIFWSIKEEKIEILKILISKGIPTDIENATGESPLIAAVKNRASKEILQCLLTNGAKINESAMIWAASKGHLEVLKILIDNGADGNLIASDDNTLLAIAVRYKQLEIVKHLTRLGVSVCKVGPKGKAPLLWAVENEDLELIDWLLHHGAFYIIHSVFLDAIKTKNLEIVKLLYDKNSATSSSSVDLVAALSTALEVESFDISKYLLGLGATLSSLGTKETVYLLGFLERKNHEMAELLIENGAKINNSYSDHTPLTKAVAMEDLKMTEKLILYEADINLPNPTALTPLSIAARRQNFRLFEYLVRSGANIDNDPFQNEANLRHYYQTAKEKILKEQQLYLEQVSNQEAELAEQEEEKQEVDEVVVDEEVVKEKTLAERNYYVIEFD